MLCHINRSPETRLDCRHSKQFVHRFTFTLSTSSEGGGGEQKYDFSQEGSELHIA